MQESVLQESVVQEARDGLVGELFAALEAIQLDEEGDFDDCGAELFNQVAGGAGGAASGEQVVDDDDALAGFDGIAM